MNTQIAVRRSLLVLSLLLSSACAWAGPSLTDAAGTDGGLDAYLGNGKWVVLMFWASDCHICNEEAPALNAFHERHKHGDAIMLGVSLDGAEGRTQATAFVHRHGVTYDNLLMEARHATALYSKLAGRAWIGTPTFLVFGPSGTLKAQQVGAVEVEIIEDFIAANAVAKGN